MTCEYADLDRISEIFTHDFIGGTAGFGQIHGIEAQTIFMTTAERMGLVPEDHLWHMTSGSQLAFRARNRAGTKYQSAFFDVVGNFAFDTKHGKFSFYYGFYDPKIVAQVLATSTTISLDVAATAIAQAQEATRRFEETIGSAPPPPDHMLVSFIPGSNG